MKKSMSCVFLLLLLLGLSQVVVFSQTKGFTGTVFLNGNGIYIEGDKHILWRTSDPPFVGGGGLSTGIGVKRYLNKKNYLSLELRLIQKGAIYGYTSLYATRSFEILRLNYAEIPVLFGQVLRINNKNYMVETGLGLGRLFSSKWKISKLADKMDQPDLEDFRDIDLSWIASFKFPLNRKGKKNLLLGFRYSCSLVSIHQRYNFRNMNYGIQLDYIINPKS